MTADRKGEMQRAREQQQVFALLGRLLAENENLKALVMSLAERVAVQSESLSKRAERPSDQTPESYSESQPPEKS